MTVAGSVLQGVSGSFGGTPDPSVRSYWVRDGNAAPGDGDFVVAEATEVATSETDVGYRFKFRQVASNAAGSVTSESGWTAVVVTGVDIDPNALLRETGDAFLREDGDEILRETAP